MIEKIIKGIEALKSGKGFGGTVATMYADGMLDKAIEIIREVAKDGGWIPVEKGLPPHSDELLLVQCSGKPRKNIQLDNAFELASYDEAGWYFPMYPVWDDAEVVAWRRLPIPYQKGE